MTDLREKPDATDRWRAMIDALEEMVLAAPDEPGLDPAEAEEVGRLVTVRTARWRRDTLPAAWARRRGVLHQVMPETEPKPDGTRPEEPRPRSPGQPTPPAWHE
jgi:hypothetical protein